MKKILKRIDKALPYWVEHILIGWLIQMATFLLTHSLILGTLSGSAFYFIRELYQYFIQGKTHKGKYDHVGWIAPFIGCLFVYFIFSYLL
jgi:riboflavin transporter FmnP